MRSRAILAVLLLAIVPACNPFEGTQGMSVSRSEFTNGTPRHPAPYDSALASLERCAQEYVSAEVPNPADSLGGSPAMVEPITAPVDSLVSSFRVLDKLQGDSLCAVARDAVADAIFQGDSRRLCLSAHAYRLRDEVQHELAHALVRYYPELRDPPGVEYSARRDDHNGAFFRRCVTYCPTAQCQA